jgi:hypothetical protein
MLCPHGVVKRTNSYAAANGHLISLWQAGCISVVNAPDATPTQASWLEAFALGFGKSVVLAAVFIGFPYSYVTSMSGMGQFVLFYALVFSGIAPAIFHIALAALVVVTIKLTKDDPRQRLGALLIYPCLALVLLAPSMNNARTSENRTTDGALETPPAGSPDYSKHEILNPLAGVRRVGFYSGELRHDHVTISYLLYSGAVDEVVRVKGERANASSELRLFVSDRFALGSVAECSKNSNGERIYGRAVNFGVSRQSSAAERCIVREQVGHQNQEVTDLYVFFGTSYARRPGGRDNAVKLVRYDNKGATEAFRWEAGPYSKEYSGRNDRIDEIKFLLAIFSKTYDDAF